MATTTTVKNSAPHRTSEEFLTAQVINHAEFLRVRWARSPNCNVCTRAGLSPSIPRIENRPAAEKDLVGRRGHRQTVDTLHPN